jgi:hypothetical protein
MTERVHMLARYARYLPGLLLCEIVGWEERSFPITQPIVRKLSEPVLLTTEHAKVTCRACRRSPIFHEELRHRWWYGMRPQRAETHRERKRRRHACGFGCACPRALERIAERARWNAPDPPPPVAMHRSRPARGDACGCGLLRCKRRHEATRPREAEGDDAP